MLCCVQGSRYRTKNAEYYLLYGRLLPNRSGHWRIAGVGMMAWQGANCKEMDAAFKKLERSLSIAARLIRRILPKLCIQVADLCDPKFQKLDRFFKL